MSEKKNNIILLHTEICSIAEEVTIRTNILENNVKTSEKVRELMLKEAMDKDMDANIENYYEYVISYQLQQTDLITLANELVNKYEVYLMLEAGIDFPTDVIAVIERSRLAKTQKFYKISNNRDTLEVVDVEYENKIKENCREAFQGELGEKWETILKGE